MKPQINLRDLADYAHAIEASNLCWKLADMLDIYFGYEKLVSDLKTAYFQLEKLGLSNFSEFEIVD